MKRKVTKKAARKSTRKPSVQLTTPRTAQTIKLLRQPKEGELKGQAAVICAVLEKKGGKMVVADLISALEGKIETKNVLGMRDVYAIRTVLALLPRAWWR